MTVKYDKLFAKLKAEKITQAIFKSNANISSATLMKLLHNESVTIDTICKICDFFCCMPDEIMEFIPEPYYDEKKQAKAKLEQQIAELQKQLKEI